MQTRIDSSEIIWAVHMSTSDMPSTPWYHSVQRVHYKYFYICTSYVPSYCKEVVGMPILWPQTENQKPGKHQMSHLVPMSMLIVLFNQPPYFHSSTSPFTQCWLHSIVLRSTPSWTSSQSGLSSRRNPTRSVTALST